ncbi:MAG: O-antigen ligase family protein [Elusimicrobia bacterium]|nr:O-antigen ligase family protein [Elusimicrobiota bacterium]
MKYIFFGFFVAYNPIYIYYLMSHGALGGMTIRLAASSIFLLLIIFISFVVLTLKQNGKLKFKKSTLLSLMNVLFVFFIIALIVGFIKGNGLKYLLLDTFPILEMFIIYYTIRLSPIIEDNYDFEKIFKWFGKYLFLMSVTGIVSYIILSFVKVTSFGALRAYVAGVTVNRMMDFIIPMFLPIILLMYKYKKRNLWFIALTIACAIITMLTFYRTIYLAVLLGVLYLSSRNLGNIFRILKVLIIISIITLFVLMVLQKNNYLRFANKNILGLVKSRIISIYNPEKGIDTSASDRLNSNKEMLLNIFSNFPSIAGLGGYYINVDNQKTPYHFTSNYFLQVIALLGIPAGVFFIGIYLKTFFLSQKLAKNAQDLPSKMFFNGCTSILVVLFIILNIFPYVNYFPLLYLFSCICGIVDKYSIYLKQEKEKAFAYVKVIESKNI